MNVVVIFCESCHKDVLHMAPAIVEVPKDHGGYGGGQGNFCSALQHN